MQIEKNKIRVVYSFPHKLGADRICYTAWQQVNGLAAAGADVLVFPGVLHKPLPANVKISPTLARGKLRIPYKLFGTMQTCAMHDYIVSRRIEKLAGQIDIIHAWPLGALQTLKVAAKLGIPTVLERPNAHTRFAYEVVKKECERLGVVLPVNHEHAYKADVLNKEEKEYQLADRILCPSAFVLRTFTDQGISREKLMQHQYGFDEKIYYPDSRHWENNDRRFSVLYVGGCAPRKGLHYALDAWLQSAAFNRGTFFIAGEFVPGYAEKLRTQLSHPSIRVLGFRRDVPELMRNSDILILPSVEEGSALVTSEARGSGCVLLVSDATGAICKHMENALVHPVGDVRTLMQHINLLYEDRILLKKYHNESLKTAHQITWNSAGIKLLQLYREVIDM